MQTGTVRHSFSILVLLTIGGVSGYLATLARIPLAWMVAPLITVGTATIAFGLPQLPIRLRHLGQIVVGSAVGLHLTPAAIERIGQDAVPILLGAGIITIAACLIGLTQIRFARTDPATAIFSSVPGGPMDMALMAANHGGDATRTAISQTIRIAMVVVLFPPVLILYSAETFPVAQAFGGWTSSGVLIAVGALAGIALAAIRFLNPYFMGPLIVVGALTGLDVGLEPHHEGVVPAAQVLLGTSLGGMFQSSIFRGSGRFLAGTVATTLVLIAVSAAASELLAVWFDRDFPTMLLSNAPGATTEMVITAQVLHLDVPMVASYQIVRIVFGLLITGLFFRLYLWANGRLATTKETEDD